MTWREVPSAWKGLTPVVKYLADRFLEDEPSTIVDLGVDQGFSLFSFASLWPSALVIGVDSYEQRRERLRLVKEFQLEFDNVELFVKDLRHVALDSLYPFEADIIHHDAKHNETVQGDIAVWMPHLRKGGLFLFHDYHERFPKLVEAVDELPGTKYVYRLCNGLACWVNGPENGEPHRIIEITDEQVSRGGLGLGVDPNPGPGE